MVEPVLLAPNLIAHSSQHLTCGPSDQRCGSHGRPAVTRSSILFLPPLARLSIGVDMAPEAADGAARRRPTASWSRAALFNIVRGRTSSSAGGKAERAPDGVSDDPDKENLRVQDGC